MDSSIYCLVTRGKPNARGIDTLFFQDDPTHITWTRPSDYCVSVVHDNLLSNTGHPDRSEQQHSADAYVVIVGRWINNTKIRYIMSNDVRGTKAGVLTLKYHQQKSKLLDQVKKNGIKHVDRRCEQDRLYWYTVR